MKVVRSHFVNMLLVTLLLTSCMSHQEYYKEIGLNEDGLLNGKCIYYVNAIDSKSTLSKIEHKENSCSFNIKNVKDTISFCIVAKNKLYNNNFYKTKTTTADINSLSKTYRELRNKLMKEDIEEIKSINTINLNLNIAQTYFKSEDLLNDEIPSYKIEHIPNMIKSCDDLFLKDLIAERVKNEEIAKEQLEIYYERIQEKTEEAKTQELLKHYHIINDKVKKLGFLEIFQYSDICPTYTGEEEFARYDLISPIGFTTIGNMYVAINNCNLSTVKAKKYFIVEGDAKFKFINYDNHYAYYRADESDIQIAVKRKQNQIYTENSILKGKYFKFSGLIEVSRLILKNSRLQILAFEEVNLNQKDKQFIDNQINEIINIKNR